MPYPTAINGSRRQDALSKVRRSISLSPSATSSIMLSNREPDLRGVQLRRRCIPALRRARAMAWPCPDRLCRAIRQEEAERAGPMGEDPSLGAPDRR